MNQTQFLQFNTRIIVKYVVLRKFFTSEKNISIIYRIVTKLRHFRSGEINRFKKQ